MSSTLCFATSKRKDVFALFVRLLVQPGGACRYTNRETVGFETPNKLVT